MPIRVIDTIKPNGVPIGTLPSPFPTVEDIDILGGFQIQPNNNYRTNVLDAIPIANQKVGMLVFEPNTPAYYTLTVKGTMISPLGTWALANLGGTTNLAGDVTGLATANTVVNIHGASVPVSGSLTTGNTLQVSGSSALTYAPLNLAGGVHYVSGALPAGNQASQTMAGDVTGTTAASTVAKIQGTPVSTNSVANDGYVLVSTGGNYVPAGIATVYNVKNFGAKGDGTTDDTAAIQAGIDATPIFATLYFPAGTYKITSPLIMRNNPIVMNGQQGPIPAGSSGGAFINWSSSATSQNPQNFWTGPLLILGSQGQPFTVTQTGNFYCLNLLNNSSNDSGICLSETQAAIINGWGTGGGGGVNTGFTFECWANPQGTNPTLTVIAASGGERDPAQGYNLSFRLAIVTGYALNVSLTTTSGTVTFTTAASTIPTNTLSHIAVTYDQSHIRLFVAGNLVHTAAQTGTIVQEPWEDFTIGYQNGTWPLGFEAGINGTLQVSSIRLSSKCWYTSNFSVSTTELKTNSGDGGTVALVINFDPSYMLFGGAWVQAYTGLYHSIGDPVYYFLGHSFVGNESVLPIINNAIVQNITFNYSNGLSLGEGIYCYAGNSVTIHNVAIAGPSKGITIVGGYDHIIERCFISTGVSNQSQSWCIGFVDNPGGTLNRVSTCTLNGGYITMVTTNGGFYENCFINNGPTLTGMYCVTSTPDNLGNLTMINCIWDDEGIMTSDSGAYIAGMATVRLSGNTLQGTGQSSCTLYKIGNCGYVELDDIYSILTGTNLGIITFTSPLTNNVPIILKNRYNEQGNTVPVINPDGYGPVIIPTQEQFGMVTVNFGSNANFSLAGDQQLFGIVKMTDTSPVLTGPVNVIFPYLTAGYKRIVINNTAQTLTFVGTSGTGVAIPSSASGTIFCNGTNWIQIS
jgi:hypothetical protein